MGGGTREPGPQFMAALVLTSSPVRPGRISWPWSHGRRSEPPGESCRTPAPSSGTLRISCSGVVTGSTRHRSRASSRTSPSARRRSGRALAVLSERQRRGPRTVLAPSNRAPVASRRRGNVRRSHRDVSRPIRTRSASPRTAATARVGTQPTPTSLTRLTHDPTGNMPRTAHQPCCPLRLNDYCLRVPYRRFSRAFAFAS